MVTDSSREGATKRGKTDAPTCGAFRLWLLQRLKRCLSNATRQRKAESRSCRWLEGRKGKPKVQQRCARTHTNRERDTVQRERGGEGERGERRREQKGKEKGVSQSSAESAFPSLQNASGGRGRKRREEARKGRGLDNIDDSVLFHLHNELLDGFKVPRHQGHVIVHPFRYLYKPPQLLRL